MSAKTNGNVLVTGAARGIGEATTRRLAKDGTTVIALDQQHISNDNGSAGRVIPVDFDLSDRQGIKPLIEKLIREHGPITRLVNNAGVWPGGSIIDMTDDAWDMNFAVNVNAPFAMIRALAPGMIAAGGGAIVTVASRNAFRSSTNNAAYDASKAAVVALTRTAAGELARHGIRVNAVCPGIIATPGDAGIANPLFKAAYERLIPMDRYGRPEEIADVITFLLSEQASYLTGQAILVDGGQMACQDNARFMEIPGLRRQPAEAPVVEESSK